MEMTAPPIGKVSHRFAFSVMTCAFCGIHIPLIGMLVYLYSVSGTPTTFRLILVVLGLTLAGTAATILILNRLLRPLKTGSEALQQYLVSHTLPTMPQFSNDELGILFQQVEYLMFILQKTVSERNNILEVAITSNTDFQQTLHEFVKAREAALLRGDDGRMKVALEEVLANAKTKLDTAGRILRNFGETAQVVDHS
jgi:hypothetical protein